MPRVIVVGAGPAGIAAAIAAGEAGASVMMIDDNPSLGGQIWRASVGKPRPPRVQKLIDRLARLGVNYEAGATVIDSGPDRSLVIDREAGIESIPFDAVVLATGARELFLPFPGWTLPGCMGAGGAQALLKGGANFEGKRVVVAGSGPLLFAVGASFAVAGAEVVGVFEQAPLSKLVGFGLKALHPKRLLEATGYFTALGAAPYETGVWVTSAQGDSRLEILELTDGSRTWSEPCDLLACAYRLVPNTELAELMGCKVNDGAVTVDSNQQTTIEGVYAAGEPLGIGGLDLALAEGTLAGAVAARSDDLGARRLIQKLKPFRDLLAESFALRPELLHLAKPDTFICRCEDVRLGDIDPTWSARQAKLYTRIGMGPCQGRVCGAAARCLFGWQHDRARPPLYPTGVNHLATQETL